MTNFTWALGVVAWAVDHWVLLLALAIATPAMVFAWPMLRRYLG